jgi:hypothetical protein
MISPKEALRRAENPEQRSAARIYGLYEEQLATANVLDFDDLIRNAIQLLQSDRSLRERWQRRWECALVDEYQDIEPAQERLVQLLAAPEDSLFAVGDEDQCIYTWRRAEVSRSSILIGGTRASSVPAEEELSMPQHGCGGVLGAHYEQPSSLPQEHRSGESGGG